MPRLASPSPARRLRCTLRLPSPAPYACAQALSLNSALEERGVLDVTSLVGPEEKALSIAGSSQQM